LEASGSGSSLVALVRGQAGSRRKLKRAGEPSWRKLHAASQTIGELDSRRSRTHVCHAPEPPNR
jgi:hypothetical protein